MRLPWVLGPIDHCAEKHRPDQGGTSRAFDQVWWFCLRVWCAPDDPESHKYREESADAFYRRKYIL